MSTSNSIISLTNTQGAAKNGILLLASNRASSVFAALGYLFTKKCENTTEVQTLANPPKY
jgi:hypothetical protein